MPILNQVERRSTMGRIIILAVYFVLILGGATMVLPFALMVVGSVSSGVDAHHHSLVPRYFHDDDVLLLKFLEHKYGSKQEKNPLPHINLNLGTDFYSVESMLEQYEQQLPELALAPAARRARANDWADYVKTVAYDNRIRVFDAILQVEFAAYLKNLLDADVTRLKTQLKSEAPNFYYVTLPFEDPYRRDWRRIDTAMRHAYDDFMRAHDLNKWSVPIVFDSRFIRFLVQRYATLENLNTTLGTKFNSMHEITLTQTAPPGGLFPAWFEYIRDKMPLRLVELRASPHRWQLYLKDRFDGDIARARRTLEENQSTFADFSVPTRLPDHPKGREAWIHFVTSVAKHEELAVHTSDTRFRTWLRNRYDGSVEALNHAWATKYVSFDAVRTPLIAFDIEQFQAEKGKWRWFFIVDNYRAVWRAIAIRGRALWNTVFLCVATVLAALTVNPMCAYALSRFNLGYTHKILLFLIAPMAFPAMVAMVPNFILLKELGLLNTYWALILPGLANGFFIFLLKGFFDSLPRELYESATTEGANEVQIFTYITLPMVKPILAVQALGAFTAAYGGFMWAFIICQDPQKWTIMVYLYQFQKTNPYHLVMASLVISSLPLLIMFLFAQRIIMRGIVIPVMK